MIVIQRRLLLRCPGSRIAFDAFVDVDEAGRFSIEPLIQVGFCRYCHGAVADHKAIWLNLIGVST